jgi:hypothetical protein
MTSSPGESVFALQIGGVPVLTFQAVTHREAAGLPREQWLRNDLQEARSNGAPLWDGKAKLSVRQGSPEEVARFLETKTATVDGSDDLVLVYLVELD